MPNRPQGQWRPVDLVACAFHVGRIAIGPIAETYEASSPPRSAADGGRASEGAKARAANLTPERRRDIAALGTDARWKNDTSASLPIGSVGNHG